MSAGIPVFTEGLLIGLLKSIIILLLCELHLGLVDKGDTAVSCSKNGEVMNGPIKVPNFNSFCMYFVT